MLTDWIVASLFASKFSFSYGWSYFLRNRSSPQIVCGCVAGAYVPSLDPFCHSSILYPWGLGETVNRCLGSGIFCQVVVWYWSCNILAWEGSKWFWSLICERLLAFEMPLIRIFNEVCWVFSPDMIGFLYVIKIKVLKLPIVPVLFLLIYFLICADGIGGVCVWLEFLYCSNVWKVSGDMVRPIGILFFWLRWLAWRWALCFFGGCCVSFLDVPIYIQIISWCF